MTFEQKIELPPQRIMVGENQDLKTLEDFSSQPTVKFYFEKNDELDEFLTNKTGSVTRARSFNINGIKFIYPVQEFVDLPTSVFELVMQASKQELRRSNRSRIGGSIVDCQNVSSLVNPEFIGMRVSV